MSQKNHSNRLVPTESEAAAAAGGLERSAVYRSMALICSAFACRASSSYGARSAAETFCQPSPSLTLQMCGEFGMVRLRARPHRTDWQANRTSVSRGGGAGSVRRHHTCMISVYFTPSPPSTLMRSRLSLHHSMYALAARLGLLGSRLGFLRLGLFGSRLRLSPTADS